MRQNFWAKFSPKQWSKGFISIEMIIVLVVLLSILAGVAGRVGQLFTSSNSASAASNILSLETSVQTIRSVSGFGIDGTDLLAMLQSGNNLPSTLTVANGKVLNEWGGEVKITAAGSGQGFKIFYGNVPNSAAGALVTQLLSGGTFSGVTLDATTLKAPIQSTDVFDAIKNKTTVDIEFLVGPITGP